MSRIIRLFCDADLDKNSVIALEKHHVHYLRNVLRRDIGDAVALFNGRDGEWLGHIETLSKNQGMVALQQQTKGQEIPTDLMILCAPIKKDRFDFCLEKTVELGAAAFAPVLTQFTDVKRTNLERLQRNAIEAAQQCGAAYLIDIHPPQDLKKLLDQWAEDRPLYVAAERHKAPIFNDVLATQKSDKAAILMGPEGGFSDEEFTMLAQHPCVKFFHLGGLTLRTETALTSAVTLYQSLKGAWNKYQR